MGLNEVSPPMYMFGEDFKKRHDFSLFRTDTWEMMVGIEPMNLLAYSLGASFCKWGFLQSSLKDRPVDKEYCI